MKKTSLFWYKVPFGKRNFGDELSPYIIKKLTGNEVAYIPLIYKGISKKAIICYPKALLTKKLGLIDIFDNIKFLFSNDRYIVISIGSIIGWHTSRRCIIWGSGIMSKKEEVKDAIFKAVRGKYTQKRLLDLGYSVPETIGDPAILCPLVYNPAIDKKYKLGIIPHHFHFQSIYNELKDRVDIKIINLLDPIEDVIDAIISCELTVSSSLHGIIVSHAYNIKSLWYNLSSKTIGGDDIKFLDYFSSVNIIEYSPFNFNINDFDTEKIYNNILKNNLMSLPDSKIIKKIQRELIKVAPFKVLERFN